MRRLWQGLAVVIGLTGIGNTSDAQAQELTVQPLPAQPEVVPAESPPPVDVQVEPLPPQPAIEVAAPAPAPPLEVQPAPEAPPAQPQPAAPAEQVQPAAPAPQPAAPAEQVQPAAPAPQPAAPAEPAQPAAPAEVIQPAAPAEVIQPAAPAETVQPAAPAEVVQPAAPAETVQPAAPAEAVQPTAPAAPPQQAPKPKHEAPKPAKPQVSAPAVPQPRPVTVVVEATQNAATGVDAAHQGPAQQASDHGRTLSTSEDAAQKSVAARNLRRAGKAANAIEPLAKHAPAVGLLADGAAQLAKGRSVERAGGHALASNAAGAGAAFVSSLACAPLAGVTGGLAVPACVGLVGFSAAAGSELGGALFDFLADNAAEHARTQRRREER
jgi:hypothetical protein